MTAPPLVIAAHGSADPRFAEVVDAIAAHVGELRPGIDVRVGYLEHGPPNLPEVAGPGSVVVPLLLSRGYHVRVDLPDRTDRVTITQAVGPDPLLAAALADRLVEAGYDGRSGVTLGAAGSADERALTDVRLAADHLADRIGVAVAAAFVSTGAPRVAEVRPRVIAAYLLAPGAFHDALRNAGADIVSAPIGDHPVIARLVLDRYDTAGQVPGRIAPA